MDQRTGQLPIIASCDDCGACCTVVTLPPFRHDFGESGEAAWERLRWDRPDLRAELLAEYRARSQAGTPGYGTPCLWYDPAAHNCRHYDFRPQVCRDFALGSQDCRDARRRARVLG